jgi:hypothetical protein
MELDTWVQASNLSGTLTTGKKIHWQCKFHPNLLYPASSANISWLEATEMTFSNDAVGLFKKWNTDRYNRNVNGVELQTSLQT